jgi:hypothetical protein
MANAAEVPFNVRLDWRSEGEIFQVWFHREFNGRLVPTSPIAINTEANLRGLLLEASIDCRAHAKIGLPNWSTTTGSCTFSRADGVLVIEIVECIGTQASCRGAWRIAMATGAFAGVSGSGSVQGYLVDPSPLPWFWNGPVVGFNLLEGVVNTP